MGKHSGEAVKLRVLESAGLRVAGYARFEFPGRQLEVVATALDMAQGVAAGRGDCPVAMKTWKVVCAVNMRRFQEAWNALLDGVRARMAEADTPEWRGTAVSLRQTWENCWRVMRAAEVQAAGIESAGGPEECPPIPDDHLLGLALGDDGVVDHYTAAVGRPRVDFYQRSVGDVKMFPGATLRAEALMACASMLEATVSLQLALVRWDRVPSRLSGCVLVDLAWMFDAVPGELQALLATSPAASVPHEPAAVSDAALTMCRPAGGGLAPRCGSVGN